jgi:periplasmic protein TonB
MKKKNVLQVTLWTAAVILSLIGLSCTNSSDTADKDPAIGTDTSASTVTTTMQPDSTAANTAVAGKPNPAKKGMKGKVSVEAAAPKTPEAKMEADAAGVYANVEIIPSFPGGYKGMQEFFDKNLEYPEEASREGVEGTVELSFIVDENGKLTSPQVIGMKQGYGLEEEALRVLNKMPVWNPGKLKGKNVKTRFNLPVRFVLQ